MLGAFFALRHAWEEQIGALGIVLVANVLLVAHVFVLNDWSNLTEDLKDPNRAKSVFTARGVGAAEMSRLATGLLLASAVLFSLVSLLTMGLALGVAAISALYSLPRFNWKGRPLLSSAAHLAGGLLHFMVGYSLGNPPGRRAFIIATFFAVTFAAGHLVQEIRDHAADLGSATRTNTVTFGRRRAFAASLSLFTLSHALLFVLALAETLPRVLAGLIVLYPIHLRWSLQALAEGLTHESVCRLQIRYRAIYAVIGLAMMAALRLN